MRSTQPDAGAQAVQDASSRGRVSGAIESRLQRFQDGDARHLQPQAACQHV